MPFVSIDGTYVYAMRKGNGAEPLRVVRIEIGGSHAYSEVALPYSANDADVRFFESVPSSATPRTIVGLRLKNVVTDDLVFAVDHGGRTAVQFAKPP